MLRGTLSRSDRIRTVKLSEPQAAAVKAATLEGETKDETLYRLIRLSQTECNETIKPIPVGTRFVEGDGGKPGRHKNLVKGYQYSGQLHRDDEAKLSDLVDAGRKAHDILEAWITCGAQVIPKRTFQTAEEFYAWLSQTYSHDERIPLEGVLFHAWGCLSYRSAIAWLEELDGKRIWLYAWPEGQKTLKIGNRRMSWLEFKPRPKP